MNADAHEPLDCDRRKFAQQMAWGAVLAGAAMTSRVGTSMAAAQEAAVPAANEPAPAAPPQRPLSELDLWLALAQQLTPGRLEEAQIAEIRQQFQSQLARSRTLSAFPLTNSDEPCTVFRAYRGPAQ